MLSGARTRTQDLLRGLRPMLTLRSKNVRAIAAFVALLALAGGVATSCRGVVVGDGKNGVGELCDLLRRCFGESACSDAALELRFASAKDSDNDTFLKLMNANQCLSSCSAAKACWDSVPVCQVGPMECATKEECCQFTVGKGDCDDDTHACCIPQSVACTPPDPEHPEIDPTPCCDGRVCKKVNSNVFTCGGDAPCVELGEACETDASCCSKLCEIPPGGTQKVCVQKTCGDINVGCEVDGDCCDDLCCSGSGTNCPPTASVPAGHCARPLCDDGQMVGDPCTSPTPCDPKSTEPQCCGDLQYECVSPVGDDSIGICTPLPHALPPGFDCSSNAGCCPVGANAQVGVCGLSGICQVSQSTCTVYDPTVYSDATKANCGPQFMQECCGGCFGGKCACGLSSCHSPKEAGPPIGCLESEPLGATREKCALAVCAVDPACCCLAWENACVIEALTLCPAPDLQ